MSINDWDPHWGNSTVPFSPDPYFVRPGSWPEYPTVPTYPVYPPITPPFIPWRPAETGTTTNIPTWAPADSHTHRYGFAGFAPILDTVGSVTITKAIMAVLFCECGSVISHKVSEIELDQALESETE